MKIFLPYLENKNNTIKIHKSIFEYAKSLTSYEVYYSQIFRLNYIKSGINHFVEVGKESSERNDGDIIIAIFKTSMYFIAITKSCYENKGTYIMINDNAKIIYFDK